MKWQAWGARGSTRCHPYATYIRDDGHASAPHLRSRQKDQRLKVSLGDTVSLSSAWTTWVPFSRNQNPKQQTKTDCSKKTDGVEIHSSWTSWRTNLNPNNPATLYPHKQPLREKGTAGPRLKTLKLTTRHNVWALFGSPWNKASKRIRQRLGTTREIWIVHSWWTSKGFQTGRRRRMWRWALCWYSGVYAIYMFEIYHCKNTLKFILMCMSIFSACVSVHWFVCGTLKRLKRASDL